MPKDDGASARESRLLNLVHGGRIDEATSILEDIDASEREDPLVRALARVKIASITGKQPEGREALEEGLLLIANSTPKNPLTAIWERDSTWTVARCELIATNTPAKQLTATDVERLLKISNDEGEATSTRFDALRVLYLDSYNLGKLAMAREYLLDLLKMSDRLGLGINSQGAQALTLAAEFYLSTGELDRAGEFASHAFNIHSRNGGRKNYFALRDHVVGSEVLISLIIELRREESDSTSGTDRLADSLKEMISNVETSLALFQQVNPDLLFRMEILKAELKLLPSLPWLLQLKEALADGGWVGDAVQVQKELYALALDEKVTRSPRQQAEVMRLLSIAYGESGDRTAAAEVASKALQFARKGYSLGDFRLIEYLNSVSFAYLLAPNSPDLRSKAQSLTIESLGLVEKNYSEFFPGSTFLEKASFATSAANQWPINLLVASSALPEILEEYEAVLQIKGYVHRATRSEYRTYRKDKSGSELQQSIRRKTSLAEEFVYRWDDGSTELHDIQGSFPWKRLEELASNWRVVSKSSYSSTALDRSIQAVHSALKEDEVLVDFLRIDVPGVMDRIVAYVLGPSGKIERVDIGPTGWVEDLMKQLRASLYEADNDKGKISFEELSQYVWSQHFSDITSVINQVNPKAEIVYIVPTRELFATPFNALKIGERYFGERYSISLLFSAYDLVDHEPALGESSGVLIVGDIDYGNPSLRSLHRARLDNGYARTLRVSKLRSDEFENLLSLYSRNKEIGPSLTLSKRQVQEEAFKESLRNKRMVHLQTHGFGVAISPMQRYLDSGSPMIRTVKGTTVSANFEVSPLFKYGLAFTGTNQRDDRNRRDVAKGDDGIMSAAEIALLDMSEVRLAVLSSCDSAIGEYYSNEMMLGLAAAFDYAGVDSVVGTITKVNDYASSQLMSLFHEQLLKGISPAEALKLASIDFRDLAVGDVSLDYPKFWAPFIVFGVQRPVFIGIH